jgi:phosphohistidine phosphatase
MKTLLILRHGKAQPDAPDGDRPRELVERGRRGSAAMGAYISTLTGVPDAILTSDARRAVQTAEIVADAAGFTGDLTIVPQIYGADLRTLVALVRSILDEVDTAVIVGHNPGFEELAAALAGIDEDDVRLPTAGLAHLEFDVDRWDDVREGKGRWRGIATPKTIAAAAEDEGEGAIEWSADREG